MPALILIRHGQASFGAPDYDVLSGRGRAQVAAVTAALGRRGLRVERVLSGSLTRQINTAEPLAAAAGVDLHVDTRWNEYDSEDLLTHHSALNLRPAPPIGSTPPEATPSDYQATLDAALSRWVHAGDDSPASETWGAFSGRVLEAASDAAAGVARGGTVVVATSGGVIAAVCTALLGAPSSTVVALNRVGVNTGITKIAVGRRGLTLLSFNDHGHLEGAEDDLLTYR